MQFFGLSFGWSVTIGWLSAGLALLYLPVTFLWAFSAGYHPFADGAHFAVPRMLVAAAGAVGLLILAAVLSFFGRRFAAALRGVLLYGGVAAYFATFAVAHALYPDPRPYIKMTVGSQVFAVPRQYNPTCGELRGGLCGMICWSTKEAQYADKCPKLDGMPTYVSFELSDAGITSVFSPRMSLERMSVIHEGDLVLEVPEDVRTAQIEGGDIAVQLLPNLLDPSDAFYLDHSGRIIGFVERRVNGPWYRILQKTDLGTLAFDTSSSASPLPETWDQHSAYARELLAQWRCEEPNCDGRFTE